MRQDFQPNCYRKLEIICQSKLIESFCSETAASKNGCNSMKSDFLNLFLFLVLIRQSWMEINEISLYILEAFQKDFLKN